jgi:hypothetical protein
VGALKGPLSFSRFQVRGELPSGLHETFLASIRHRAFRPLEPAEDEEERTGWCSIANPFDLDLDHSKVFFTDYLNLGLRVDRWRIPRPLLKTHLAEAERAHLEQRGREKLSRREKKELEFFVAKRLRSQVMPSMRVVDLSWNLSTGMVRFWSNASRSVDGLMELFQESFGLQLVPEGPYTTALRLGLSEKKAKRLDALEPAVLAPEAEGWI